MIWKLIIFLVVFYWLVARHSAFAQSKTTHTARVATFYYKYTTPQVLTGIVNTQDSYCSVLLVNTDGAW